MGGMPKTPCFSRYFLLLLACLIAGAASVSAQQAKLVNAFPALRFERPLELAAIPDGTGRLVIVEQAGRVLIIPNDRKAMRNDIKIALDLTGKNVSRKGNEEGMLGLAFHPDFANNRQVIIHYSASNPQRGVVSRFTFNDDVTRIDPASERIILEIPQPWGNHNGGCIAFGPDGLLYLGLGDGGSANDPNNNGQNLGTWLGSILRLDLDGKPGNERGEHGDYWIPADNPFLNHENARPEIFAYGLRNPWRFSFDHDTGQLWCGDVGQEKYEEITLIQPGGNHGWRIREGFKPFDPKQQPDPPAELIDPVVAHDHRQARSITGGRVYHGNALPKFDGAYIYADYLTGRVWALWYDGDVQKHRVISKCKRPTSFGTDADGELYICDFVDPYAGRVGIILKLVPR